jgi:glucosylceramidase
MTHVKICRTSQNIADRLSELPPSALKAPSGFDGASVLVDLKPRFQTIQGFGGAFTEATATTFFKMSPPKQAEILRAYFDKDTGNGYTLCRTHINSCDFALGNYAYTEVEGDTELKHFSIERDRQALIPMIKEAIRVAGGVLTLFASPWSPPAWMKTNGQMNRGGKLKPEYRKAWARYYCRFIREYEREGIPIWGLSVQNEPEAVQSWDSCIYTGEEERDFVRDYLGPTLHEEGLRELCLIIWDHNRDRMVERAKVVLDDPAAAQFVWGTGFHWYVGDNFENVQRVHDAFPDKHLIFTEGCQEGGPHIGEWPLGERYARSIIQDLNHWTVAWIDWNLILDERGGPNHVGNYCSAPIIADTKRDEIIYQSSYFYLGHFSRFIRPGAERILCASTSDELETTAFINPDGEAAVVVLNRSDKTFPFALKFNCQEAKVDSLAHSILTLRFYP